MTAPRKPPVGNTRPTPHAGTRRPTPAAGTTRPTSRPSFDHTQLVKNLGSRDMSSTVPPPSSTTSLEEELLLPEQRFFSRLEERARRAELLNALLQAKGISTDRAVRALQAALGAIVTSAEEAHLPALASLGAALQSAIGELGLTPGSRLPTRSLDVLVLDETEISCDLVALAVEAHGHMVRSAGNYEEFVRHIDERLPDLIITDVQLVNAPARQFCAALRELLVNRPVPFVFFSAVSREELEGLARTAGAAAAISKDSGLAALMTELDRVLPAI
jgi:CheY-like chemotaxis protein